MSASTTPSIKPAVDSSSGSAYFRFMDLPTELRYRIYGFVVPRDLLFGLPFGETPHRPDDDTAVSLLFVSKVMSREVKDEATRYCRWTIYGTSGLVKFLRDDAAVNLRNVTLAVNYGAALEGAMNYLADYLEDMESPTLMKLPSFFSMTSPEVLLFKKLSFRASESYNDFVRREMGLRLSGFTVSVHYFNPLKLGDYRRPLDDCERPILIVSERVQNLIDWLSMGLRVGGDYAVELNSS